MAILIDGDHIRRQMRLVATERAEALRMRLFLDRSQIARALGPSSRFSSQILEHRAGKLNPRIPDFADLRVKPPLRHRCFKNRLTVNS